VRMHPFLVWDLNIEKLNCAGLRGFILNDYSLNLILMSGGYKRMILISGNIFPNKNIQTFLTWRSVSLSSSWEVDRKDRITSITYNSFL